MSSFFPETVNVVGNSSVLLDRNYGQQIDKNFTIRFNNPPLEYDEIIHFGNRLDWLWTSNPRIMGEEAIRKALGSSGKLLYTKEQRGWTRRGSRLIVKSLRKDNLVIDLPCEVISACELDLKNSPFNSSGCIKPSNGFLALYYLDYLRVKSVNLFGFTFFKGAENVSFRGEEPSHDISRPPTLSNPSAKAHLDKKGVPHHDWYNEKNLVMNMVEKNNWRVYE